MLRFSRAPEDTLLAYLCRFTVRSRAASLEVFLGSVLGLTLRAQPSPSHLRSDLADLPTRLPYMLGPPSIRWINLRSCVTPSVITVTTWFRNFNRIPIAYAFRPRLRGRLTLSGLALLRKPWAYGGQVSHLSYRYSCRHNLFRSLHATSSMTLQR